MKEELLEKIDNIVATHERAEAIKKIEGYFKQFFWNNELRIKLGNLYLQESEFIKAGKMLYFKNQRTESEERAVVRFVESCGNNKMEIFRKLIGNYQSKPPRGIDIQMNKNIFELIFQVLKQENILPKEVANWIIHYERIRNIEIENNTLKI